MPNNVWRPLECGGTYAELILRPLPEGMSLAFVPSLVALLMRAEEIKGAPLTREEVIRIRDSFPNAIVTPSRAVQRMSEDMPSWT